MNFMTCSTNIFLLIKPRRMRPARHIHVCGGEGAEVEAGFCFGNLKKTGKDEDIGLDGR
jgi:hypothetical protein